MKIWKMYRTIVFSHSVGSLDLLNLMELEMQILELPQLKRFSLWIKDYDKPLKLIAFVGSTSEVLNMNFAHGLRNNKMPCVRQSRAGQTALLPLASVQLARTFLFFIFEIRKNKARGKIEGRSNLASRQATPPLPVSQRYFV